MNFDDDVSAFDLIKYTHGVTRGGVIYPIDPTHVETPGQKAAINYLCSEWDYEWMKEGPA